MMLTFSRKMAKILTVSRKSHRPIETSFFVPTLAYVFFNFQSKCALMLHAMLVFQLKV